MNEQQYRVWKTLKTKTRRAMRRTKNQKGWTVNYRPKGDLVLRVMEQENISKEQAYSLLRKIREIVIKESW